MTTAASLGRNDPCHCGSGRKYKRCHLDADAAARRAAQPLTSVRPELFADPRLSVHAAGIGRALRAITEGRVDDLPLAHLRELLAAGQPLAALRFDATRFAEAVATHAALPTSEDAGEPWRGLFEASAAALVPQLEPQRERWLKAVLDRLDGQPSAEDARALQTAAAMLLVGRLAAEVPAEDQPLFDEVFLAQLAELAAAQDALAPWVTRRGTPRTDDLARLATAHPAMPGQLASLAPSLAAATPPDAAAALSTVTAAITSAAPPPVLALDELLWFETRFVQLVAGVAPAEEIKRARSEAAVTLLREAAEEFGEAARERAARLAVDPRLSDPSRTLARALAVALGDQPVKVMLALVRAPDRPVQWRSPLERKAFAKLRGSTGARGLDEYAAFLDGIDELDAATRVRDVLAMHGSPTRE